MDNQAKANTSNSLSRQAKSNESGTFQYDIMKVSEVYDNYCQQYIGRHRLQTDLQHYLASDQQYSLEW